MDAGSQAGPSPGSQPQGNLTGRTLHGFGWTYLSAAAVTAVAIASMAVLARILGPAAFGLFAMTTVVIRFGGYFAQLGVGAALVQARVVDDKVTGAAFLIALTCGLALSAIFFVGGPIVVMALFRNPEASMLVRWSSLTFVLDGPAAVGDALLRRRMEFKRLAIVDILSYALGYSAVGIGLALAGVGALALVVASLGQSAVALALGYAMTRYRVRIPRDRQTYRGVLSYGGRYSLASFSDFAGYSIPPLVIGRYLGADAMGLFSNGQKIANSLTEKLVTSLTRVLFPAFSARQDAETRLRSAYAAAYLAIGICACVLGGALAASARQVTLLVLGTKWVAAIPVLQLLAIAAPATYMVHASYIVMDSMGRLNTRIRLNAAYICVLSILTFIGLKFGLIGVVGAYCANEILFWAIAGQLSARAVGLESLVFWNRVGVAVGVGVLEAGGVALCGLVGSALGLGVGLTFALQVVGGALVLMAVLLWPSRLIREDVAFVLERAGGARGTIERSAVGRWYLERMSLAGGRW